MSAGAMSAVWGPPCALVLACALGCEGSGGAGASSGASDETTSSSASTSDGGTTFTDAVPCEDSTTCTDGVCVAPYDPGAGTGVAGMGTAVCVPGCVAEDSLDEWCTDDASCCAGLECSALDGFCVDVGGSSTDDGIGETWVVDSSSESTDGAGSSTTDATTTDATTTGGSSTETG